LPGSRRPGSFDRGSFFEHHMDVGPSETEGTHPGAGRRRPTRPGLKLLRDPQLEFVEWDMSIGPSEMEAGRRLFMLEREHRFDQAGDACRSLQMSNIAFDRADQTGLL